MKKKEDAKKVFVKQLRKEVMEKLSVALADYKTGLGDEKYSKILKRTSKTFVSDYTSANGKVKEKKEKKAPKQTEEVMQEK